MRAIFAHMHAQEQRTKEKK